MSVWTGFGRRPNLDAAECARLQGESRLVASTSAKEATDPATRRHTPPYADKTPAHAGVFCAELPPYADIRRHTPTRPKRSFLDGVWTAA